jgi:hypothetical protein
MRKGRNRSICRKAGRAVPVRGGRGAPAGEMKPRSTEGRGRRGFGKERKEIIGIEFFKTRIKKEN